MKELYVFCEGSTEQKFCKSVLELELFPNHDGLIHTVKIANSHRKHTTYRGGVRVYEPIRNDIRRFFKSRSQREVAFTSFIDLYRLPSDFPGKKENTRNPDNPRAYVEAIEQAFFDDLGDERFVPHIQLHEFETLLFANPKLLELSFDGCEKEIGRLVKFADGCADIEKINDTEQGAPSKRIIGEIPEYGKLKTTVGPDIAECIGLTTLCEKCAHFGEWIDNLSKRVSGL